MKLQKRLAGDEMKCSPKRVWLNPDSLAEVKEAITREDVRGLIRAGIIVKLPVKGVSRGRAKKRAGQKKKGRRKNQGSRKGTQNARGPKKENWMHRIRKQRAFIKLLKRKNIITIKVAKELYQKAKGGFFRSRGHLKLYLKEHNLALAKK